MRRYVHNGRKHPLQVVQTPAGRLGVLVGSDSWYPENHRQLAQQAVQLIANPVFLRGKSSWKRHGVATATSTPPPGCPCSAAKSANRPPGNA
jgi:predicted amidohydrolase